MRHAVVLLSPGILSGPLLVMKLQPKLTSTPRSQKGESTCRGIPRGKAGAVPAIAMSDDQRSKKKVVPLIAL